MDLVHSHSVANELEGLSRFDGTKFQYFHKGDRGIHPAWRSRIFDYGKPKVCIFFYLIAATGWMSSSLMVLDLTV